WLLWLTFRAQRNAFKEESLEHQLKLPSLLKIPGMVAHSGKTRIRVKNQKGPWQSVEIGVYQKAEIETPQFTKFLTEALRSFESVTNQLDQNIESLMPWAKNGEQWHDSPKGFPPGKGCQWDRELLTMVLRIVRKLDPEAEINFNLRDAIHIKPSHCKAFWLRLKTKGAEAFEVITYCKKGQFNLARIDGLTPEVQFETNKAKIDECEFLFCKTSELSVGKFTEFLKEVRQGLVEAFGAVEAGCSGPSIFRTSWTRAGWLPGSS